MRMNVDIKVDGVWKSFNNIISIIHLKSLETIKITTFGHGGSIDYPENSVEAIKVRVMKIMPKIGRPKVAR